MSALQRLREQMETAFANARTLGDEKLIGRAIVELQEQTDFRECAELRAVRIPPEFSLPSPVTERSAVPPTAGGK